MSFRLYLDDWNEVHVEFVPDEKCASEPARTRVPDAHPTHRCPTHDVPLVYTRSRTQVVCTADLHCPVYIKLKVRLTVKTKKRIVYSHVSTD